MSLNLKWETPNDMPFEMPIEVKAGDRTEKINVTNNFGWMLLLRGEEVTVDPNGWILKAQ
jgi:hypothetical protein